MSFSGTVGESNCQLLQPTAVFWRVGELTVRQVDLLPSLGNAFVRSEKIFEVRWGKIWQEKELSTID